MKDNEITEKPIKVNSALNVLLVAVIVGFLFFAIVQFGLGLKKNIENEKELLHLKKIRTTLEIEVLRQRLSLPDSLNN